MKVLKSHELLPLAKTYLPQNALVIEAGAFNGKDSIIITQQMPKSTVYAFEPVPKLFTTLQKNTTLHKNIHCFNTALSNRNGNAKFYCSEKPNKPNIPSQAGSLHAPKERLKWSPIIFPHTIEVQTITIDSWAQQHNVTHIDFMWLDMQGHELAALSAATNILQTTRALIIEVSFIEGYENQPLADDVITFMKNYNFTPIARNFVDTKSWFFGNILFVRNDLI